MLLSTGEFVLLSPYKNRGDNWDNSPSSCCPHKKGQLGDNWDNWASFPICCLFFKGTTERKNRNFGVTKNCAQKSQLSPYFGTTEFGPKLLREIHFGVSLVSRDLKTNIEGAGK
jgi:hypothetical protein